MLKLFKQIKHLTKKKFFFNKRASKLPICDGLLLQWAGSLDQLPGHLGFISPALWSLGTRSCSQDICPPSHRSETHPSFFSDLQY